MYYMCYLTESIAIAKAELRRASLQACNQPYWPLRDVPQWRAPTLSSYKA